MKTAFWNWIDNFLRLSQDKIAFIFPAFISDYRDDTSGSVPGFSGFFRSFLSRASELYDPGLVGFDPVQKNMLDDELRNQFLTYIYGCTCAETLLLADVRPSLIAGYSMGIYASLYSSDSISFEAGLSLIFHAYTSIRESLDSKHYGMGSVIGLAEKDIRELCRTFELNLVIVNRNSDYSFILAGDSFHIHTFLLKAREEGALSTKNLGVTIPYHTNLLEKASKSFSQKIHTVEFMDPVIPMISLLDQELITCGIKAKEEVIRNLITSFDWFKTQNEIQRRDILSMTECGPGVSLSRNAKFIPGSVRFVRWSDLVS